MIHTCVLYVSRYGATRDTAQALAQILGPARASLVAQFAPAACACEFVVIGTPIFGEVPDPPCHALYLTDYAGLSGPGSDH
jgi:flavodoxin